MGRSRKDPYPPPPHGGNLKLLSEGGGRKNVLGCPKGGRGNADISLTEGLRL